MKKVGIITFHCADNFGAVLQVYALQQILKQMDIDSEIIDFRPDSLIIPYDSRINWIDSLKDIGLLRSIKRFFTLLPQKKSIERRKKKFKEFRKENLITSECTYLTVEELKSDSPLYEYYITGSDQVWNPQFFDNFGGTYFLDFAKQDSIKISYAASLAEKVDSSLKDTYKQSISRFNYISIREKEHVDFLRKLTDKPIAVTLDPTLLLDKSNWENVEVEHKIKDKYIIVYDLQGNKELIKLADRISIEKGYKVISFTNPKKYRNGIESFAYEGPGEFLGYFKNSELILTTSFHGVAFSIIYNKPFYTIPHTTRGSRMIDLLTSIGLESRIIYQSGDLVDINYSMDCKKSIEILEKRKRESITFLKNALDVDYDSNLSLG